VSLAFRDAVHPFDRKLRRRTVATSIETGMLPSTDAATAVVAMAIIGPTRSETSPLGGFLTYLLSSRENQAAFEPRSKLEGFERQFAV
jgi:hypothetical protein